MKHPKHLRLVIASAVGALLAAGCSHPSETVTTTAPPISPQQQIQQIQSDPNMSAETKAIRLHAAQDRLGPNASHYPQAHSAASTGAPPPTTP